MSEEADSEIKQDVFIRVLSFEITMPMAWTQIDR
jgi:hypothetical protein